MFYQNDFDAFWKLVKIREEGGVSDFRPFIHTMKFDQTIPM